MLAAFNNGLPDQRVFLADLNLTSSLLHTKTLSDLCLAISASSFFGQLVDYERQRAVLGIGELQIFAFLFWQLTKRAFETAFWR
jgi:hypothetical protein